MPAMTKAWSGYTQEKRKDSEMEMKYPEYDSPFELTISDIATQMEKKLDELSLKAVQKVGIDVDKDKLLAALKQDAERYREAYAHGYDTGYEKRDEEIVRCKDCKHGDLVKNAKGEPMIECALLYKGWLKEPDWYCADAERREAE